jgi:MerR family copper efflux transcriptional regulator
VRLAVNIGQAAKATGLPTKTIRYYEEIGLVAAARRAASGYREYDQNSVRTLRFVQRARALGFSVEDCRGLLALWRDRSRASAEVRSVAIARIGDIDSKIAELEAMRRALGDLVQRCHGDDHPDCPILDDLSDPQG